MTNALTSGLIFGDLLKDQGVQDAFSDQSVLLKLKGFERAWTQALMTMEVVSTKNGKLALTAIDTFNVDWPKMAEASNRDGLPIPELVRQIRANLPDEVKNAIHSGVTSQDVIDTAMVLISRDLLEEFASRAAQIIENLRRLDQQFGACVIMGRTRMQAALPITVHNRLNSWLAPLEIQVMKVGELVSDVATVQVGGPVGLRNLPEGKAEQVAKQVAETLKLELTPVWHTDRSRIVDCGHWLVQICGVLGKMGQDIALMSQQGIGEVNLSGAGGSSAMPHKQNPIRAEIIVSLSRFVSGHQGLLGQSKIHEQERSGASWGLEWLVLPAMYEAAGAALNNANMLLNQIEGIGRSSEQ